MFNEDGSGLISVAAWIAIGVVVWCVAAVVVAVVLGRMVAQRDRQRPQDPIDLPGQRTSDPTPSESRVPPLARLTARLGRRR